MFNDSIKSSVIIIERSLSMTDAIPVNHVRYVKLGTKDDNWENICSKEGWIPLGYQEAIDIYEESSEQEKFKKTKAASASIRDFFNLGEDTVWVMFKGPNLYWGVASKDIECFGTKAELEKYEENIKKNIKEGKPKPYFLYRTVKGGWQCVSLKDKDGAKPFNIQEIDGRITQTAIGQHSICHFKGMSCAEVITYISNLINGEKNSIATTIDKAKDLQELENLIKGLHHSDFELLVANIYIQLGYILLERVGGSNQKHTDLVLLSPENKRVVVQIKTTAGQNDFNNFNVYAEAFKDESKAYFIYHTQKGNISKTQFEKIELVYIDKLLKWVENEEHLKRLKEWLKLKCYFGKIESDET